MCGTPRTATTKTTAFINVDAEKAFAIVAGVNGERGKQKVVSAKTRTWAIAEEAKHKLEDKFREADPPSRLRP